MLKLKLASSWAPAAFIHFFLPLFLCVSSIKSEEAFFRLGKEDGTLTDLVFRQHHSLNRYDEIACPCLPLCVSSPLARVTHRNCWGIGSLRMTRLNTDATYTHICLHNLMTVLRGQSSARDMILAILRRKLNDPTSPVIVHLAGDNGVGKTLSAFLVSRALSLYPHPSVQNAGENLFLLNGAEYAHLINDDVPETLLVKEAAHILERLLEHIRKYVRVVLVLDELVLFPVGLVRLFAPFLSCVESGIPFQEVDVSQVFVFMTSDFGSGGATRGWTPMQVRNFVWEGLDTIKIYNVLPLKKAHLIPFVAFTPETFRDVLRFRLDTYLCAHRYGKQYRIVELTYDDPTVIEALYEQLLSHGEAALARNGREVNALLDRILEAPLARKVSEFMVLHRQGNTGESTLRLKLHMRVKDSISQIQSDDDDVSNIHLEVHDMSASKLSEL